jgi:hypothetical protein
VSARGDADDGDSVKSFTQGLIARVVPGQTTTRRLARTKNTAFPLVSELQHAPMC